MTRLLLVLIAAGLLALGAAWIADRDGVLTLTTGGYELRTSAGFAALLVLLLAGLLGTIMRLVFLILRGPAKLGAFFAGRRTRQGQDALGRGLLAAEAGDTAGARKAAQTAERLLGGEPLVQLLKAEAARLSGEEEEEEATYRAMLSRGETEFLGARGLFALAMRHHDTERALVFALRAHTLRPGSADAANALFELRMARREWAEAEALLAEMTVAKVLTPDGADRRRAELLAAQADNKPAVAMQGA